MELLSWANDVGIKSWLTIVQGEHHTSHVTMKRSESVNISTRHKRHVTDLSRGIEHALALFLEQKFSVPTVETTKRFKTQLLNNVGPALSRDL